MKLRFPLFEAGRDHNNPGFGGRLIAVLKFRRAKYVFRQKKVGQWQIKKSAGGTLLVASIFTSFFRFSGQHKETFVAGTEALYPRVGGNLRKSPELLRLRKSENHNFKFELFKLMVIGVLDCANMVFIGF
jgi:hypothetical protein